MHNASKTFVMDEAIGCARVKVQFGDSDQNIQVYQSKFAANKRVHIHIKLFREDSMTWKVTGFGGFVPCELYSLG